MYLGIFIILYHSYKAYIYNVAGKNYWVNLGPLGQDHY